MEESSAGVKSPFFEKLPLNETVLLGFQHMIAMFIGNITPILIIAPISKISDPALITVLVQGAMISSAIATLVQLYPISLGMVRIGSQLPVIMGASFGFMSVNTSIAAIHGLSGILGAQIVGGLITLPFGLIIHRIRRFFPPIVTGTVVLSIGLSLFPIAMRDIAGGVGSPDFGSFQNLGLGFFVLSIVIYCTQYTKGFLKLGAIFVGVVVGYIVAVPLGKVNLSAFHAAGLFELPTLFPVRITFHADAILAMSIMYFVTALQLIGDFSATTMGGMNREVESNELSGGILGNGISAIFSSLVGGLPTATFSQNVGLITLTKVCSRMVIATAVGMVVLAGVIPKIAALITSIPRPVLGGATVTVFSLISITGIRLIAKEDLSLSRNSIIVGLSLAIGSAVAQVPGVLAYVNPSLKIILGSSVIVSSLLAALLNIILPKEK